MMPTTAVWENSTSTAIYQVSLTIRIAALVIALTTVATALTGGTGWNDSCAGRLGYFVNTTGRRSISRSLTGRRSYPLSYSTDTV